MTKFNTYMEIDKCNKVFFILIKKLVGNFFKQGKKEYGIKFLFELKYLLKNKTKHESNLVLLMAIMQSMPKISLLKKKVGKMQHNIPIYKNVEGQARLAVKNVYSFSKSTNKRHISVEKMMDVLLLTCKKKGPVINKNYRAYKVALENRSLIKT